jgi:hypothetical protein
MELDTPQVTQDNSAASAPSTDPSTIRDIQGVEPSFVQESAFMEVDTPQGAQDNSGLSAPSPDPSAMHAIQSVDESAFDQTKLLTNDGEAPSPARSIHEPSTMSISRASSPSDVVSPVCGPTLEFPACAVETLPNGNQTAAEERLEPPQLWVCVYVDDTLSYSM